LEQVSVAKKDIKIRSQREVALLAVNQADVFCNEIIPLWKHVGEIHKEKKIPIFQGDIKNFDKEENEVNRFDVKFLKEVQSKIKPEERHNFFLDILMVLNKLESLSNILCKWYRR
jgi:hypothetical protein